MGDLTKNFSLQEFQCKDGSEIPIEYMDNLRLLTKNLQVLRDHINLPIRIISGYRSPSYNRKINGARKSQHMLAKASDIKISRIPPDQVRLIVLHLIEEDKMMQGGVGRYTTFTHYDVRGRQARWSGTGIKDDRP